ncbi:MAG: ParA family protein [bacterium]|nr:ParA family protein [bacterium]
MKTLALYNIKGGVGKTASAVNLSFLASLTGSRVLVWDLDPQGAATFYFRIKPKIKGGGEKLLKKKNRAKLDREIRGTDFEGLDLVPADFSYRNLDLALDGKKNPARCLARLLEPMAEEYDYVFLDCAPSISLTSESIHAAADLLLVPTIPTPLSVRTLEQLDRHLRRQGPEDLAVVPFMCMVDRRKKLHRQARELVTESDYRFRRVAEPLETQIPYSSLIEQMGVHRMPLHHFAYRSAPAKAYRSLWREIEAKLNA